MWFSPITLCMVAPEISLNPPPIMLYALCGAYEMHYDTLTACSYGFDVLHFSTEHFILKSFFIINSLVRYSKSLNILKPLDFNWKQGDKTVSKSIRQEYSVSPLLPVDYILINVDNVTV